MIIIYLAQDIDPEQMPAIRSALIDKLWEHGVKVDHVDMDPWITTTTGGST
jgi:uncharacterized protein YeaO (DUF488 family)